MIGLIFFVGWHQPVNGISGCRAFAHCMISINRLINRRSDFEVSQWILDSGAFSRIVSGKGHLSTKKYADLIRRWAKCGQLLAAVSQDYMCEPFVLQKTGLSIKTHQELTIHRYDRILSFLDGSGVYLMPVLQGYSVENYLEHIEMYGDRLAVNQWVGVGSVCKRNGSPRQVENILIAIHQRRSDLRLHGFGLKKTALESGIVWDLLHSADSQAHSFRQRKAKQHGEEEHIGANNPIAALAYSERINSRPLQLSIWSQGCL